MLPGSNNLMIRPARCAHALPSAPHPQLVASLAGAPLPAALLGADVFIVHPEIRDYRSRFRDGDETQELCSDVVRVTTKP